MKIFFLVLIFATQILAGDHENQFEGQKRFGEERELGEPLESESNSASGSKSKENGIKKKEENWPLFQGLTYYPWRLKSENCSSVSDDDIREDFDLISKLTKKIQIFDFYCNFTPLIIDLTRKYNMELIFGFPFSSDSEFESQKKKLKQILEEYDRPVRKNETFDHILAIAVGRLSVLKDFNKTEGWLFDKVNDIRMMLNKSKFFKNISVTILYDCDYDEPVFEHSKLRPFFQSIQIISAKSDRELAKKDPVKFFHKFLDDWDHKFEKFWKKGPDKKVFFTEFGFPFNFTKQFPKTEEYFFNNVWNHFIGSGPADIERFFKPEEKLGPIRAEIDAISRLFCGIPMFPKGPGAPPIPPPKPEPEPFIFNHRGPGPDVGWMMKNGLPPKGRRPQRSPLSSPTPYGYFYDSTFDLPFYFGYDDPQQHWGLANETRDLKPIFQTFYKDPDAVHMLCKMAEDQLKKFLSISKEEEKKELRNQTLYAAIGVIFLILGVSFTVGVCCYCRQRKIVSAKLRKMQLQLDSAENSNAYVRTLANYFNRRDDSYIDLISKSDYENLSALVGPEWLIEDSSLHFQEIIGEGHFGIVQRAQLTRYGEEIDVAVKRLHVGAKNVRQFLSEGILMEQFHHPNILPLVGISFTSYYLPMIITPFMEKGDLLSFVKNGDNRLTVRQLLKFGLEISEGMRYMHGLKLIHRDLAARNCMLDDKLTVKIADFGLCRDISDSDSYQAARASDIPVRWMPPETIERLEWNEKSDVWSYGVVIWELFTRGKQPYTRVPLVELRAFLHGGGRLSKPDGCPDVIYDLMKNCWHGQAEQRPDFEKLCDSIPSLVHALEGERILDLPDYYNALTVMEMSQQQPERLQIQAPAIAQNAAIFGNHSISISVEDNTF